MTATGNPRDAWRAVLAAERLAAPDTRPARLTLFGEELAAFRNSEGVLGIIDGLCPHNGSLLAWGVAEEGGLTCAYHGWAFGPDGTCLWVPGAASFSQYNLKAYPLVEHAGLLWTNLGSGDQPPLPEVPWAAVPAEQRAATQWQVLADTADAALAAEVAAAGWPAQTGGSYTGPGGLVLHLQVTEGFQKQQHCCALLWHPNRPLSADERAAMATRASGPMADLAGLTASS